MADLELIIRMDGQERVVSSAAQAEQAIRKVGTAATETGQTGASAWTGWQAAIVTFNAGLEIARQAVDKLKEAYELAEAAAKFDEQRSALDNLSRAYGTTADTIIEEMTRAAQGTISQTEAVRMAAQALTMGINPASFAQLTEVAHTLSISMGIELPEAFRALTTAVATGNERVLRHAGMIIDLQGAYENYARSIGTVASKLTDQQHQQVALNTILASGADLTERMGNVNNEAAESFGRASSGVSNLKLATGQLIEVTIKHSELLEGYTYGINILAGAFAHLARMINNASDARRNYESSFTAQHEVNVYKQTPPPQEEMPVLSGQGDYYNPTQVLVPTGPQIPEIGAPMPPYIAPPPPPPAQITTGGGGNVEQAQSQEDLTGKIDGVNTGLIIQNQSLRENANLIADLQDETLAFGQAADSSWGSIGQNADNLTGHVVTLTEAIQNLETAHINTGMTVSQVWEDIKETGVQAAADIISGALQPIMNALAAEMSAHRQNAVVFQRAMLQMTASVLMGVAQQAAVKAIFALAEGWGLIASHDYASSGAAFHAAALYGAVAGVATIAAAGATAAAMNLPSSTPEAGGAGGPSGAGAGYGNKGGGQQAEAGIVVNIHVEGHIVDSQAFVEEHVIPAMADAVGRGVASRGQYNLVTTRD